jgi:hypothetical protein
MGAPMAEHDDGFLSRWSRRKAQVQQGVSVAPEAAPAPALPVRAEPVEAAPLPAQSPSTSSGRTEVETPPAPTLDDVAALTKDSDFKRFVAPDVDPGVKNAAMKKLFASDPHFNVMDGLDVYIDDYNKFEPVPESIMRQLFNARTLGLLDDELEEQPKPDNAPPADEDADLQLQPHDAAGQPGAGTRVAGNGAGSDDDPPDAVPPRGA